MFYGAKAEYLANDISKVYAKMETKDNDGI
jgi:hypothetical protein